MHPSKELSSASNAILALVKKAQKVAGKLPVGAVRKVLEQQLVTIHDTAHIVDVLATKLDLKVEKNKEGNGVDLSRR